MPVTAAGTGAASRAVVGLRGHAVLLLSELTFVLNALFKRKTSKKSAGGPCSDLRVGSYLPLLPAPSAPSGPSQSLEGPSPLPSSASSPLVATAPSGMWGRRGLAGAGSHSTGKSWPVGGVWALLWGVGHPLQPTTPTPPPLMLRTTASPIASLLPMSTNSF